MDLDDLLTPQFAIIFFTIMIPLFIVSSILSIGLAFLPFIVLGVGGLSIGVPRLFRMLIEKWDLGEMTHLEYFMNPGGLDSYEQFIDAAKAQAQGPIELPSPRQGRVDAHILQALFMQKQQKIVESSTKALPSPDNLEASDEIMYLGTIPETSEPFAPHANHFLGVGVLAVGVQGAGKTNAVALLIEQAGKCYIPSITFDLKGEYHTITGIVPNGIRAGHPSISDEVGSGFYSLTVENAAQFASDILNSGFQAVVDLPSYGDQDEAGRVIAATLNGLLEYAKSLPFGDRAPCLLFQDEAHYILPERQELTNLSKDVADEVQKAYFKMVNIGRSYGFTVVLATQRMANVKKWAIANLQIKFIMKQTEKNDLHTCEEIVRCASRDEISSLRPGHAIVVAPDGDQFIVLFNKRESEHFSHTPQLERAHRRYRDRDKGTSLLDDWAELTGEKVEPEIDSDTDDDDSYPFSPSRSIDMQPEDKETKVLPIIPEEGKRAEDVDIDVAVLVWNAGHNSVGKLMKTFKLTNHQAQKLRKMILEQANVEPEESN